MLIASKKALLMLCVETHLSHAVTVNVAGRPATAVLSPSPAQEQCDASRAAGWTAHALAQPPTVLPSSHPVIR